MQFKNIRNLLIIDTSTKNATVAISKESKIVWSNFWKSKNNHSIELMDNIKDSLVATAISIKDLDCIAVATGPGGFSSIRVGVSVALGLANPNDTLLLGVPTFEIEFEKFRSLEKYKKLVSLIPAGLNAFCWKSYDDNNLRSPDGIVIREEIYSKFEKGTFFCGEELKPIFENYKNFKYSDRSHRDPEDIIKIINRAIDEDAISKYRDFSPIYSRSPNINSKKERD